MTLSLYVVTNVSIIIYCLSKLSQLVTYFVFGLQHVTDLSGRETMVRITGKDYIFLQSRLT